MCWGLCNPIHHTGDLVVSSSLKISLIFSPKTKPQFKHFPDTLKSISIRNLEKFWDDIYDQAKEFLKTKSLIDNETHLDNTHIDLDEKEIKDSKNDNYEHLVVTIEATSLDSDNKEVQLDNSFDYLKNQSRKKSQSRKWIICSREIKSKVRSLAKNIYE